MYVYVNTSMFKTKLTMVYCQRDSKSKTTSFKWTSSTWFYENYLKTVFLCNKLAENYNMHNMLRCFNLLENREHLLENILNTLDVNEYVDFEIQTIQKQCITLLGCTNYTSFENISFGKWKQILQCISLYVYKISNLFTFDCRC